MSLEEIRNTYSPKEEFTITTFQSKQTGKFIACVYKKVIIQTRYNKEICEASLRMISEVSIDDYLQKLSPYLKEKNQIDKSIK